MYCNNRKAKNNNNNKMNYNDPITIDGLKKIRNVPKKDMKQRLRIMVLTRLKEAAERGENSAEVGHIGLYYDYDIDLLTDVLNELEKEGYTVNTDYDGIITTTIGF